MFGRRTGAPAALQGVEELAHGEFGVRCNGLRAVCYVRSATCDVHRTTCNVKRPPVTYRPWTVVKARRTSRGTFARCTEHVARSTQHVARDRHQNTLAACVLSHPIIDERGAARSRLAAPERTMSGVTRWARSEYAASRARSQMRLISRGIPAVMRCTACSAFGVKLTTDPPPAIVSRCAT